MVSPHSGIHRLYTLRTGAFPPPFNYRFYTLSLHTVIDKATIDRIYSAVNIVEIIGDFVTLKKKGVNYMACCPFHNEKTPSFVVSPAKGVFKCFGCGKAGNAVTFVMEHEGLSYPEALKYVAKRYGIEVEDRVPTEEEKKKNDDRDSMMEVNSFAAQYFISQLRDTPEGRNVGMSYFKERGMTVSTIEKFSLGYCPTEGDAFTLKALAAGYKEEFLIATGLTIKRESGGYWDRFAGRVIFPVVSLSGRVIAFGGRTLRTDKKTAKYLNSPESEVYHKGKTLYGIYHAKKSITQENRCILVEGYTDVLSMVQSGVENVVASSGTSLTTEQIKLISRFTKNITVIYDGDAAGIKASLRGIDMILAEGLNVRCVSLPDGEDPDSFARSHTATELNDYIVSNEVDFITFKTRLLLDEVKNDPMGRAEVITDIVRSIAAIPDSITRSEFARSCARMLDSDEQLIVTEVERRRISVTDGHQGGEVMRNYRQKEQIEEKRREEIREELSKWSAREELEKELVTYLLRYGSRDFYFEQRDAEGHRLEPVSLNVADTIIEELEVDNITIESPLYKKLFDSYVELLQKIKEEAPASEKNTPDSAFETETPATTSDMTAAEVEAPSDENVDDDSSAEDDEDGRRLAQLVGSPDVEVTGFVVDMMMRLESRKPSRIWSRYDDVVITEGENLAAAVPKTIALYKLEVINNIILSISSRLDSLISDGEPDDESLALLAQLKALTDTRKVICLKYSRIL